MAIKLLEAFVALTARDQGASAAIEKVKREASGLAGVLRPLAGLVAGGIGFAALAKAAKASIAGFAESQRVSALLESQLKATGNSAMLSAQDIRGIAAEIQKATKYEDDAVASAAAQLLRFRNISGDVFEQTIKTAADMASVMGGDLAGAADQLGAMLNNPLRGLMLLQRQGVTFTAEQQNQIRVFSETNKVAEAQKIILGELAKMYGGAAASEAETLTGKLEQLKNAAGDLGEQLGALMNGPAGKALKWMADAARGWTQEMDNFFGEDDRLQKLGDLAKEFKQNVATGNFEAARRNLSDAATMQFADAEGQKKQAVELDRMERQLRENRNREEQQQRKKAAAEEMERRRNEARELFGLNATPEQAAQSRVSARGARSQARGAGLGFDDQRNIAFAAMGGNTAGALELLTRKDTQERLDKERKEREANAKDRESRDKERIAADRRNRDTRHDLRKKGLKTGVDVALGLAFGGDAASLGYLSGMKEQEKSSGREASFQALGDISRNAQMAALKRQRDDDTANRIKAKFTDKAHPIPVELTKNPVAVLG